MLNKWFSAAVMAVSLLVVAPSQALATEKAAVKEGFAFPDGPVKILVFRPDVAVGEQSTGGMNEPNAEWTEQARKELDAALQRNMSGVSNELVNMPELAGDDASVLADYQALFQAVTNAVIAHKLFPGNRLPTKKEQFDWTLGPGIGRLGEVGGGEYGLFIYTYDSYGSAGRKAAQLVGAMFGFGITSGVHIGYAGLVDMKSGDLVWINADVQMGGDVRDAEGADKRIKQLLEEFPKRGGALAPTTVASK